MIGGFGAHYRLYRLAAALDRLRAMPPGARLTTAKAAHLLGTNEAALRSLLRRYAPAEAADDTISAATLRAALSKAHAARKNR